MDIKSLLLLDIKDIKSILLENKSVKQTILKNTFWLALAEIITRSLKLILLIWIARILGATEYGKFTFALSFVSLFVVFSDLGVSPITIREFSRDKTKEKEFPAIFSLKIFLGIGSLILITIGSFFITPNPLIQKLIWILSVYIVLGGLIGIISAFLQARQKMEYNAFIKMSQAILTTGIGFLVLLKFPSVQNLSLSYLLASLISFLLISLVFHFKFLHIKLAFNKVVWLNILKMSWPLAFIGIFSSIYNSIDSVMMGHWGQIKQTGWYNASYKVIGVALVPMALISQSFYPALSKAFKSSKEQLQKIWNRQVEIMIFLSVPLVIGGIVLAPKIIQFIYGVKFLPGVLSFQILLIMTGIAFVSNPLFIILIIANQQKKIFWITILGAITNVILNFLLIPRLSLNGAAISTTITYTLILFLFLKITANLTPIKPLKLRFFPAFLTAVFLSVLMCLIILRLANYSLNIFLLVAIGAMVYLIFFLIVQKLTKIWIN